MNKCILIVNYEQYDIFEDFFMDNDFTQVMHIKAKAVKKNFFLNLLNLSDIPKSLFMFMAKSSYVLKLEKFCSNTLNYKNSGILLKLKGDMEMTDKAENDKLVVTIIKSGFTELVIDALKSFEVSGATIIGGKGVGKGHSSFLGMGIDSEREVVLIACKSEIEKKLQNAIKKALIKNKEVNGVSFSLPLEDFIKFNEQK